MKFFFWLFCNKWSTPSKLIYTYKKKFAILKLVLWRKKPPNNWTKFDPKVNLFVKVISLMKVSFNTEEVRRCYIWMYFFPSSIEAEIVKIIAMNTRKNIFFLCLNVSCYKSTRPIRHMHVNSYSCTYTRKQPPFTHTRRIKNLSAIKTNLKLL